MGLEALRIKWLAEVGWLMAESILLTHLDQYAEPFPELWRPAGKRGALLHCIFKSPAQGTLRLEGKGKNLIIEDDD
ncbi:hypothetical protein X801_09631 [Opisthorchis viverrini]|uniref:Uncharacterized protein n=2 Tax=Opisthorchis viverrini TaxID=6198 RepID=A0A1S8WJE7_OPIVI|nr:hypothetical protein T265_01353 [Opisthorchis viverrini]KER32669.1 hypothetical protein T265_01353 [Opisthorchis viverrini]OON14569.1 hypothetical protein X801_09631 [Opisthorchis viverrini]